MSTTSLIASIDDKAEKIGVKEKLMQLAKNDGALIELALQYLLDHLESVVDQPKTVGFGKWKKAELSARIMDYDVNQIHEACLGCGHTTDWEYFDKELKTYSWQDMRNLAQELQDQFGDPGQGEKGK